MGAANTVAASFLVIQGGTGNTDVVSGPPRKLLAVGPTSPDNGFPVWYRDANNLSVGLCLDDTNPFCNVAAADVPDTDQPISFPDNFRTRPSTSWPRGRSPFSAAARPC